MVDNRTVPRPTHAYHGLSQPSRLLIAYVVMRRPGLGLEELSEHTGLHENTVREHIGVLVDEGILRSEVHHRGTRGRPRAIFFAVDADDDSPVAQRRVDDAIQRGDLLRRVVAMDAGDLDDTALHQLDALYEHLDGVGLGPEIDERQLTVDLKPCRFHALMDSQPEAICQVHETLIRDVLRRAGGPIEVDRLHPLVTPHDCRLHLRLSDSRDEPDELHETRQ
jgi:predicted ArsR family transcriptional regulator